MVPGAFLLVWQPEYDVWTIDSLWGDAGFLTRSVIIVLALMLVNAVAIAISRIDSYVRARSDTRGFLVASEPEFRQGNWQQVIALARKYSESHVARVVAAALAAFAGVSTYLTDSEAVTVAEREMRRTRDRVRAELNLGLNTLASIASSAPFVGLFGTVIGILNSFREWGAAKATVLAWTANSLAQALVTAAAGILVALVAVWFRDYLRVRMEVFETEMSNASLETTTYLHAHSESSRSQQSLFADSPTIFDVADRKQVRRWEIPFDRQRLFLFIITSCFVLVGAMTALSVVSAVQDHLTESWMDWRRIEGDKAVSPDGRFLARAQDLEVQQEILRSKPVGTPRINCYPGRGIYLTRRCRRPDWQECNRCGNNGDELDSEILLVSERCSLFTLAWRSPDELVAQCTDCEEKDLTIIQLPAAPLLTILGPNGRQLHPREIKAPDSCTR